MQSWWQFRGSKWVLLVTTFLVPLYALNAHWYPFATPKALLIIFGAIVATILFLWGTLEHSEEGFRFGYLHAVLTAFLGVMAIAAATGINPHQSFFGTFYSSTSTVLLIAAAMIAVLIGEFVRRDRGMIKSLGAALFYSGVITALVTFIPHLNSSWKLLSISGGSGFVGNGSFTGGFLLFAIAFGLYNLCTTKTWSKRILYIIGLVIIFICPIFLSSQFWHGQIHSAFDLLGQAQGATLGLVVAILVGVALRMFVVKKKIVTWIGAILGIVLIGGLITAHIKLLDPATTLNQQFVAAKTGTRLVFWDIAKKSIGERPVLGWGFENYQTVYQQHFDPVIYTSGYTSEQWVSNPHHVLFDIGVSSGVLGLVLYLILFGWVCVVYVRAARKGEPALIIFPALLLGYLVQDFFIFDTPTTWLCYFIIVGIGLGLTKGKELLINTNFKKGMTGTKIAILIAAIVVLVLLPAHESRQWAKLVGMPISPESIALQDRVQLISPMGSVDDDIVYAQKVFTLLAENRTNLSDENKKIFLAEAGSLINILDHDGIRYPDSFYAPYLAGSITHLVYIVDPEKGISALDAARTYLDRARMISPRNPKVYYSLAQNALFRKDKTTAVALIKQGMSLGAVVEGQEFLNRVQP